MRRALDTDSIAAAARKYVTAGNCEKAVDLFDQAIMLNADPTLRRERGACHEKLGNVFPAIDDFRAYLVERATAPDADDIRQRLASLEGAEPPRVGPDADVNDMKAHSYEESVAAQRLREMSRNSGARAGTGTVISVGLGIQRIKLGAAGLNRWGPEVTARLSYSVGSHLAFFGQFSGTYLGIADFESPVSGYVVGLGVEARLPLDPYYSNQLFVAGSVGVGSYSPRGTVIGSQTRSRSFAVIQLPRAQFGYRHVFGANIAVDIGLDASVYSATAVGTVAVGTPQNNESSYVGLSYGAAVALGLAF